MLPRPSRRMVARRRRAGLVERGAMEFAFWHRLQFAFTAVYHYLFPQLTMGLALLVFVMKSLGLRRGAEGWNDAAAFWIRIFGINFALGVVTGVPMEFQFGTNWAGFARRHGGVRGRGGRVILCAARRPPGGGASFRDRRRDGRPRRESARRVSDGRPTGQARGDPSAARARGHGGPVPQRPVCRDHVDRS